MEENVPIQTLFDHVLRVGPIVSVKIQRYCIYSLRWCDVVRREHSTALLEVVNVHQLGDIRRQEVIKPRDVWNLFDWSTCCAECLELSGGRVPIHTGTRILEVVQRHHVARRDEVAANPADVRGLENKTMRQLPLICKVPRVVDW